MTKDITFRQLTERVARHNQPVDKARSITELARLCKVSRITFYNALRGVKVISPWMIDNIVEGFLTIDRKMTWDIVRDAVNQTRKNVMRAPRRKNLAEDATR